MQKGVHPKTWWPYLINERPYSIALQRFVLDTSTRFLAKTPKSAQCRNAKPGGVPAQTITGWAHPDNRTLLYLHGGGYMMGSIRSHKPLAAILSRLSESRGVIIHYRRSPDHPFPAALVDALAAYRGLLSAGIPASKIALAGDSAGGGLALALLFSLRDANAPIPAAAYLMSPWTDLSDSNKTFSVERTGKPTPADHYIRYMARLYAGCHDPRDPLISPVFGDFHGLCPLLIHAARYEQLRHDAARVAKKAKEHGVDVTLNLFDSDIHVFQSFAGISEHARTLILEGGAFLKRHLE